MKTVFVRALEADDKAAALLAAIRDPVSALGKQRFEVSPARFAAIPHSPFAYWVSEKVLKSFASFDPLHHGGTLVASTNPLNDDFRYARAWWEAAAHNLREIWKPWAKGGRYSPIYYDIDTVIRWCEDRATYAGFLGTENRPLERPASVQHFFRPGLTWPRRTQRLGVRVLPAGCIFGDKGPAVFVEGNIPTKLMAMLAILSSSTFDALVALSLNAADSTARSFEVGIVQRTPVPAISPADEIVLASLARAAWHLKHTLDTCCETSHAFTLPALLQVKGQTLATRATASSERVRAIEAEVSTIQAEIDARCFDLYSIDERDRRAITAGFGDSADVSEQVAMPNGNADDETENPENTATGSDTASIAAELVSWSVGVAFGRFDVRLATGARPMPTEPEPFNALQVCSPGMLTGDDGLPLSSTPSVIRSACLRMAS